LWFYFKLSAVQNLGIELGLGYQLPDVIADNTPSLEKTTTYNNPLFIGLTAAYSADKFGFKLRSVMAVGKSVKTESNTGVPTTVDPAPLEMFVDILPSYALADNATVFFSAGLAIKGDDRDAFGNLVADSDIGWHIAPYVQIKGGNADFFIGFKLWSNAGSKDDRGDAVVNWAIPLGIAFSL